MPDLLMPDWKFFVFLPDCQIVIARLPPDYSKLAISIFVDVHQSEGAPNGVLKSLRRGGRGGVGSDTNLLSAAPPPNVHLQKVTARDHKKL